MIYAKPKLLRLASSIETIGGVNGKVTFLFLDLDIFSPLFITWTAATIGAYESDE
jgi:hypothetical protein